MDVVRDNFGWILALSVPLLAALVFLILYSLRQSIACLARAWTFVRNSFPDDAEARELCIFQNVCPTLLLLGIAWLLATQFTAEDTLKHLASGSPVLAASGLLISVFIVLSNRAADSRLATYQIHQDAQLRSLLAEWRRTLFFVLAVILLLIAVYLILFFDVMLSLKDAPYDPLNRRTFIQELSSGTARPGVIHAAIVLLGSSTLAFGFSIRLTRTTYETFDRCFGTARRGFPFPKDSSNA